MAANVRVTINPRCARYECPSLHFSHQPYNKEIWSFLEAFLLLLLEHCRWTQIEQSWQCVQIPDIGFLKKEFGKRYPPLQSALYTFCNWSHERASFTLQKIVINIRQKAKYKILHLVIRFVIFNIYVKPIFQFQQQTIYRRNLSSCFK